NLGQVTAKLGKEDEAYELLVSALDLAHQIGDAALEAYTLNHLGEVYLGRDDRVAADYYEQAATRLRALDDRGYEATARSGLGQANLNLGRPAAALRCFRRALTLRRQTGEVHEQADILLDIARTALLTGEVGDARRALHEALTLRRYLPDEPDDTRVDNLLAHLDGQR